MKFKGQLLATTSKDRTCCIWEAKTGQLVKQVRCHSRVDAIVWRDEKTFITGDGAGRIQQWSLDQERSFGLHTENFHGKPVNSLDFQPTTSLLASGSSDKKVLVLKLTSPSTSALLHTLTGQESSVLEVKLQISQ